MGDAWRCFVAVPMPDDLGTRLSEAVARWRTDPRTDGLRWADAGNLHLTLAFLGATDPARVPSVEASLRTVARAHAPFATSTGRLGAFARPGSARVVWYGVGDSSGA